jgi:hypothetical protein
VLACEVLVYVHPMVEKSEGASFELGLALPIVVLGKPHSFFTLLFRADAVADVDGLLAWLADRESVDPRNGRSLQNSHG